MDRRDFLKSTGAAVAAAGAATTAAMADGLHPAPAVSRGRSELRLAMPRDESFAGPADWARRLGQGIAAMSDGRLHIAPSFAVADGLAAVRAGDADLYFAAAHDHLDAHRGLAFFAALPGDGGLGPQQLHTWVAVGGGQALWDDIAGELGVKPLLAAHTGARSFLSASERIDTMHALAGRKVHAQGLARDVARGLGMEAVSLPWGRIADSMREGEILAAECGGAIASYAAGIAHAAPYCTGTSINRNGTAVSLGVSRALWDALAPSEQAMFEAAAAAEYQLSLAEEEAHRHLLRPEPPAERVWPIAAELAHAIGCVSEAVVAHAAGTDAETRRISDSYTAFRRATATSAVA
jgi:TRAP-type mannitol/chloroaromatic compound transport system substrate-binding protein